MRHYFQIFLFLLVIGCSPDNEEPTGPIIGGPSEGEEGEEEENPGNGEDNDPLTYNATIALKNATDFPIGNIVSASKLISNSSANNNFKEVLNREYIRITAENDMKMANFFTGPDSYDYSDGDEIVNYAIENEVRIHGHTLVWHASIPGWLENFEGDDEEFETLIKDYVTNTVSHFAQYTMEVDGEEVPVVASWDVVNEVFDGASLRNSVFRQRMGSDYVSKLFLWAREADENVKLFYNDYNIAGEPAKRNAIINMVDNFKENDVPIDGLGMQMHLNHDWPNDDLPISIEEIAATGLLVHVSELDVKVNYSDDIEEETEDRALAQENQYQRAAYYYSTLVPEDQQHGLTIWGFRDQDSWLYEGGSDWPLLYNSEFATKLAHRGLVAGLQGENPNN